MTQVSRHRWVIFRQSLIRTRIFQTFCYDCPIVSIHIVTFIKHVISILAYLQHQQLASLRCDSTGPFSYRASINSSSDLGKTVLTLINQPIILSFLASMLDNSDCLLSVHVSPTYGIIDYPIIVIMEFEGA